MSTNIECNDLEMSRNYDDDEVSMSIENPGCVGSGRDLAFVPGKEPPPFPATTGGDETRETTNMDEEDEGHENEVAVATPASLHENLSARMNDNHRGTSCLPRLPLPAGFGGGGRGGCLRNDAAAQFAAHISPPTPMPPSVAGAMANRSDNAIGSATATPPTAQSHDSRTLAALYQSSRRSRTNTPKTPSAASSMPHNPPGSFFPPPPLYAAPSSSSSKDERQQGLLRDSSLRTSQQGGGGGNLAASMNISDIHKVSLKSSHGSSNLTHESWNTSMSSLMNSSSSFMNASFLGGFNARSYRGSAFQGQGSSTAAAAAAADPRPEATGERSRQQPPRPNLMNYRIQDTSNRSLSAELSDRSASGASSSRSPARPAGLPGGERPGKSPSFLTVPDLPGDSSYVGCADKLSSLQVRTREEFEQRRQGSESSAESGGGGDNDASVRSEDQGDNDDDDGEGEEPPRKKNRKRGSLRSFRQQLLRQQTPPEDQQLHSLNLATPQTTKSCTSTASFDIIAHPTSRVSSIGTVNDDPSPAFPPFSDVDIMSGVDVDEPYEVNAEEDHAMGTLRMQVPDRGEGGQEQQKQQRDGMCAADESKAFPEGDTDRRAERKARREDRRRTESPSEKEQRILRRKIQRLLLIRHCSTCPVPPPTLANEFLPPPPPLAVSSGVESSERRRAGGNAPPSAKRCPVSSHCAEGKALCAHIRTCRKDDCTYKKCLTSREVLGHFRSCRDGRCEICGPVRALDRSCRHGRAGGHRSDGDSKHMERRRSDSSIETIDDEGWLNANMMDGDEPV